MAYFGVATTAAALSSPLYEWRFTEGVLAYVGEVGIGGGLDLDAPLVLLVVSMSLWLVAGANVIVRLFLSLAGSPAEGSEGSLRGGRYLGPLERVLVFYLALFGEPTAAAFLVSMKGLLRFTEVRPGDKQQDDDQSDHEHSPIPRKQETDKLHQLSEYLIAGSLASFCIALLCAALVAISV